MYDELIPGSPRVEGDEEEEDTDDLENEFHIQHGGDPHNLADAMLAARLNVGRGSQVNGSGITTPSELDSASVATDIPLLTYGQEVGGVTDFSVCVIVDVLLWL